MRKCTIIFSLTIIAALLAQCKSTFDIKGTWAQNRNENADFVISEKQIEFFDDPIRYSYQLNDRKDLTILDSNKIVLNFTIIKLTKDSLIIKGKNEGNRDMIYKYYRR
jgi:hypothetical protein